MGRPDHAREDLRPGRRLRGARYPVAVRYAAVFFDAGETLVHPHPTFPDLFAEILRREGHDVSPERVRERAHVVFDRFRAAAESFVRTFLQTFIGTLALVNWTTTTLDGAKIAVVSAAAAAASGALAAVMRPIVPIQTDKPEVAVVPAKV